MCMISMLHKIVWYKSVFCIVTFMRFCEFNASTYTILDY